MVATSFVTVNELPFREILKMQSVPDISGYVVTVTSQDDVLSPEYGNNLTAPSLNVP
jgi:hypothetical protein